MKIDSRVLSRSGFVRVDSLISRYAALQGLGLGGGGRAWRRLCRDRHGVAVLEFAILGPVLIVLIFAMIDAVWMVTSAASAAHGPVRAVSVVRDGGGLLPGGVAVAGLGR